MNPIQEPMETSKLHNLKAGMGDGVIIALDWTGVLIGTLCEKSGRSHCFMGKQVATGDITDFFSESRIANRQSRTYRAGRIGGIVTGTGIIYGMPFLPIVTAAANGLRYMKQHDEKVREESRNRYFNQ